MNGEEKPELDDRASELSPPAQEEDEKDASHEIRELKKQKLKTLKEKQAMEKSKRENTAVYIEDLPSDIVTEDLQSIFGKFGILSEDLVTGEKRVKLYRDDNGHLKGDALVIYLKKESVSLAIEMLNNTKLRFQDANPIRVSLATFDNSSKSETKKRIFNEQEKSIAKKRLAKLNDRVSDWQDDAPDNKLLQLDNKPYTVVIKHAFTLAELEQDGSASDEIKLDIKEGCEEIGRVKDVELYDLEEDGILTVSFEDYSEMEKCIHKMNGRFFSGQKLAVVPYDGTTQYRKRT